jgi:hypothetical protein
MGTRNTDIRLTGKELFVYYFKKLGEGNKNIRIGGCTNKRILSKKTGITWSVLENTFTRKGFCYYENEEVVIMKLRTADIEKGLQSMKRKGIGGMERFVERYTIKRNSEY